MGQQPSKEQIAAFRAELAFFDVSFDQAERALQVAMTDEAWESETIAVRAALEEVTEGDLPFMYEAAQRFLEERVRTAVLAALLTA